jgi:hypothetical protein
MQRELRALARHAERMLEQAAREMGVPWSFQVWQGRAEAASLARAFGADILSLGRVSSLVSSRVWATTRPLSRQTRKTDTSPVKRTLPSTFCSAIRSRRTGQ